MERDKLQTNKGKNNGLQEAEKLEMDRILSHFLLRTHKHTHYTLHTHRDVTVLDL